MLTGLAVTVAPASGQALCGDSGGLAFFFNLFPGEDIPSGKCNGNRCAKPQDGSPFIRLSDPLCDPRLGSCAVELGAPFTFPGNQDNIQEFGSQAIEPVIFWFEQDTPPPCDPTNFFGCGETAICGNGPLITTDRMETFVTVPNVSCSTVRASPLVFSLTAFSCPADRFGCRGVTQVSGLAVGGEAVAQAIGCPAPPRVTDCPTASCTSCMQGVPVSGGGAQVNASTGTSRTGPGAELRYAAGGAGRTGDPGAAELRTTLGRYWSHDYAERIVPDPDDSHVWLITRFATFREFSSKDGSGVYQDIAPSDEYRTLTRTASGWELRDLEGTVQVFDTDGKWLSTTDRNGNAKRATYDASGVLTDVTFPDGRSETFTYHPDGKLATITEVGVAGSDSRQWSYVWNGDDLTRIDRPDGTSLEFLYEDPRHPGYLTQQVLVGTSAGRRIERAWRYDAMANVIAAWEGSVVAGPNGPEPPTEAVDFYQFSYDDPAFPTVITVTDPLDVPAVYQFDRDPASRKPRVTSVSGSCPTCTSGPNASFEYMDGLNPLRPTKETDGLGHETVMEYDAHGQLTRRLEAVETPALTRETTWEYDPAYPVLPTRIERPSVTGGPEPRVTTIGYDAAGNAIIRTEEGVEDGAAFSFTTATVPTPEGQVLSVDPPGFGTTDVTSFTYDPARGGLIVETRTDPLIGATTFGHDPFNRRSSVTDPNGVETTTTYDALDRVTFVTQKGASPAEDLVTENLHNEFGDLFRTVLPRGNLIEYSYDPAGRLVSVERKPDAVTPGERTFLTLDGVGNRIREELQSWNGSAWVTESETVFDYPTRCFLERVTRAPGTPEESVSEFAFDCDGNLEKVWDENHPRFDPMETVPTQAYDYDALERLVTVTQPWGGAGGGDVVTSYSYDVQDHLVSVTDGEGNLTSYTYSDRDLLTDEISPVSGSTTHAYNEHGELTSTTDARGVTFTREVDELDRVTAVRYTDSTLDTIFTYDDPTVGFSLGRLTAITRHGQAVESRYDRFGRLTQDGDLTYTHDANGNRTTVGYPGGVTATYSYDFADRQETLDVQVGADPVQSLVTASSYLPGGPLESLALASGATENRAYDGRYVPEAIVLEAPTSRRWDYTTDGVGNILEIRELIGCSDADLILDNQAITTAESFATCAGIQAGPAFSVEAGGSATFTAGTRIALGSGFSVASGASFAAGIDPAQTPVVETKTYAYQDFQYFLTGGDGPWGSLAWTYDRIGNRLSETRDGSTDTYAYATNAASGNTAILEAITLAVGGARDYQFGAAGHLEQVTAGANEVIFASDDEGRLADLSRPVAAEAADLLYDGRSYLASATDIATGALTEPTYSSEGLLHALARQAEPAPPMERFVYLHFAGRPVAQLKLDGAGGQELRYLITDHLGTPSVALDETGAEVWDSGFEPFGRDAKEGLPAGALANEMFLRFPGQWEDGVWAGSSLGAEVFYNVHRWYLAGTSRYTRTDPLGILAPASLIHLFSYSKSNSLFFFDPLGKDALTENPTVLDCFFCLLSSAGFGVFPWEAAAWVTGVDSANGSSFNCIGWPFSRETAHAQWRGQRPPGIRALAHTHPTRSRTTSRTGPKPSDKDEETAGQLGVPVYTISPGGIWKYDPRTDQTTLEAPSNWTKGPKARCKGRKPCDGVTDFSGQF